MNEKEIFQAAVEISDPANRQAYLSQACGTDTALRARVETLLAAHAAASNEFLNVPAMEQVQPPAVSGQQPTLELPATARANAARPAPSCGDSEDDASPAEDLSFLQPSTKAGSIGALGHYEILQMLGQGAFGIVFKAFDEKLHRHVAIKAMNPQLASTSPPRKRFLREARSAAAIKHENVVQVYSVEEQPLPYLVMEYIDGPTLQQKLDRSGPLEVPEILHLGRQMAAGLAAAHEKGLIHRDIKPGNILLEVGAEQKVKITDFGLARAADDATMTRTGTIAGTPMYMAPEQALGQTLDHRADLFSLGSVLYQMASGRAPFRGATAVVVLKRVADERPRPIQDILADVPDWLCAIIEKLHAKNPDDRFQTAKEVADLLARCQSELQLNGKVTAISVRGRESLALEDSSAAAEPSGRPERATARSFQPLILAVAAVLLLVVGLTITELTGITSFIRKSGSQGPAVAGGSSRPDNQGQTVQPAKASGWHGWPADAPMPAIAPFNAEQAKTHQEAWAKHLGVPVEFTNSIGMKFILIPPGEFTMGSTPAAIEEALKAAAGDEDWKKQWRECIKSEAPPHKVILTRPIYLGIHEVTQAQYEKVMGQNPSHFAATGRGKDAVGGVDTSNCPVEMVSWNDAAEFCAKLSEKEKLKPFYFRAGETVTMLDGTGYRLPTEAEWEFACRAGTTTKYWTGDKDDELVRAAWFGTNSGGRTHAVGELKANPFGLYDIHGNVFEWVQDWWEATYYGQFQEKPALDPNGPSSAGSLRVIRGGYWGDAASHCRASYRRAYDPTARPDSNGFRVALVVGAVKQAIKDRDARPTDSATSAAAGPPVPQPAAVRPVPAVKVAIDPAASAVQAGEPLSRKALVPAPPPLPGVQSWTLETDFHHSVVYALAYSPDGRHLATAESDGEMRIWDAATLRLEKVIVTRTLDGLASLQWSPDGEHLAAFSTYFSPSYIVSFKTGKIVRTVPGSGFDGPCASWSPDGRFLACNHRNKVVIWDMQDVLPMRDWEFPAGSWVVGTHWLLDGKRLASVVYQDSPAKTVRLALRDLASGSLQESPPIEGQWAWGSSAMSPDGRSVAVGITVGARGQVVLWDTAKCERVGELQWPGEGARALAWSADGRRLAAGLAGGVDRGVDLWDPAARQAVRRIKAKLGTTTCVAFAPDHTTVAFATDWGIWKVARIDSGEVVRESHGPYFNLLLAPRPAFSADGQWLGYAAGVLDSHAVRVWRLEGPELPRVFDNAARTADWHDFAWSRDGRFLAYRAGAANLLYDVAAGRLVANREVPGTGMVPVLSPDGKLFAAGGEKLRIQDAVSGAPVQSFDVSGTPLGWSPDGTLLAVAGKAEILLVDSTTGAVVHRLTGLQVPATLFDWSGDGSLCAATALEAKQVCVWDARSGKLLQNLPHKDNCTLRLRRDGLQCVALRHGHYGNSIWQLPSGMLEREPAFANVSARHGVSPDCRLVATTCGGVIRLEELATTKILRTLVTTPEGGSVIIGRTGHYLASPDAEKHLVYVVQTATGQETLTPEEFSKRYGWKNDPQQATGPLPYTPPAEPTPPAVPAAPPKPPATSNLPLTPPPAIAPLDAQKAK